MLIYYNNDVTLQLCHSLALLHAIAIVTVLYRYSHKRTAKAIVLSVHGHCHSTTE